MSSIIWNILSRSPSENAPNPDSQIVDNLLKEESSQHPIFEAIERDDVGLVKTLLATKETTPSVQITDDKGYTPLHAACHRMSTYEDNKIVSLILKRHGTFFPSECL